MTNRTTSNIALAYHRRSVNPKESKISIDIQEKGTRTEAEVLGLT